MSCVGRGRCGPDRFGGTLRGGGRPAALNGVVDVPVDRSLLRMRSAPLAIHPAGVTVEVVLLLPDGQAVFDLVDNVSAGAESLVAVRRADSYPYRQLPDGE